MEIEQDKKESGELTPKKRQTRQKYVHKKVPSLRRERRGGAPGAAMRKKNGEV